MKNARTRYLPLVIVPAIMPAVLMPVLVNQHMPDNFIGGAMGVSIGLAIIRSRSDEKRRWLLRYD